MEMANGLTLVVSIGCVQQSGYIDLEGKWGLDFYQNPVCRLIGQPGRDMLVF